MRGTSCIIEGKDFEVPEVTNEAMMEFVEQLEEGYLTTKTFWPLPSSVPAEVYRALDFSTNRIWLVALIASATITRLKEVYDLTPKRV